MRAAGVGWAECGDVKCCAERSRGEVGGAVCGLVVFRSGSSVRPVGEASGFYADVSESYSQDGPGWAKKFIWLFP